MVAKCLRGEWIYHVGVRIVVARPADRSLGGNMATLGLIEYDAASPEVRAVYDDIMATRKTDGERNEQTGERVSGRD